jgi:hypothetical protein
MDSQASGSVAMRRERRARMTTETIMSRTGVEREE